MLVVNPARPLPIPRCRVLPLSHSGICVRTDLGRIESWGVFDLGVMFGARVVLYNGSSLSVSMRSPLGAEVTCPRYNTIRK